MIQLSCNAFVHVHRSNQTADTGDHNAFQVEDFFLHSFDLSTTAQLIIFSEISMNIFLAGKKNISKKM